MKKTLSIIVGSLIISLSGHSQSLPSKCEAFCPSVLNRSTIHLSDIKNLPSSNYGQKGSSTNKYWDVYSDRCDNVVYQGPSTLSGTNGKKLSFNQKLRIAKVENGFAWVYIENKPGGVNYPQISSDCDPVGWLPMDNLLLWTTCPTNDVGIYRRALIVRNLDQKRDQSFGHVSQHPDVSNTSNVHAVTADIAYHYIMKEVGDRLLIAKSNRLNNFTDQILEGWVSKIDITLWNYRIFLEPTWDSKIIEQLQCTRVGIFREGEIVAEIELGKENDITPKIEDTKYRWNPHMMRFPLLENESGNDSLYHIIAFSNLQDVQDTSTISLKQDFLNRFGIDSEPVRNMNCLLAYEGYVKKEDGLGHDYWKPVMLLSNEEIFELIEVLKPLENAARTNSYGVQERINYVKAVTGLIHFLTGRSAEELDMLPSTEITNIIEGMSVSTPMLKGQSGEKYYTLSDIKNIKVCPNKEFRKMLKKMEGKIDDLIQLSKGSNFKYSFIQNGMKYYWIPLDMIP